MSKKFKFKLDGMEFSLPSKHLRTKDWNGNDIEPEISITQSAASNLLKQYVKIKFPQVTVSVSSSSFSMGNSCDVYISDEVGNPVDKSIIEDVKSWGSQFVYGKYNGMIDMYESKSCGRTTENGTTMTGNLKYLSVNNRPKFCTVPDICQMIKGMMGGDYVYGPVSLEKAIENVKGYGGTENSINKAIALI